jgi:hypothetical protein
MKLKDALALVKFPPVARQSIETRMIGWLAPGNPERKVALDRLRSQVPHSHQKKGWSYCHTVLRGSKWCHVFERKVDNFPDWTKTMLSSVTEESFDEIIIVVAYICEDMVPRTQVVSFLPKEGIVNIWPGGSQKFKSVMNRVFKRQTRRVRLAAQMLSDTL